MEYKIRTGIGTENLTHMPRMPNHRLSLLALAYERPMLCAALLCPD
jgi:hypothetical protein